MLLLVQLLGVLLCRLKYQDEEARVRSRDMLKAFQYSAT